MGNVIVIGSDHHNTLGVVESLGMVGISPYVIVVSRRKPPHSFVLKSKYCQGKGFMASYDDLIDLLYTNFKKDNGERYLSTALFEE